MIIIGSAFRESKILELKYVVWTKSVVLSCARTIYCIVIRLVRKANTLLSLLCKGSQAEEENREGESGALGDHAL